MSKLKQLRFNFSEDKNTGLLLPVELFSTLILNPFSVSQYLDNLQICDFKASELIFNEKNTLDTLSQIKQTLPGFIYTNFNMLRLNNDYSGYYSLSNSIPKDSTNYKDTISSVTIPKSTRIELIKISYNQNPLNSSNSYLLSKKNQNRKNSEKPEIILLEDLL